MAITIDDIWFEDPRRDELLGRVGFVADAVAIKMWRVAFGYHKKKSIIPKEVFFKIPHSKEFMDTGLAHEVDEGVYIKGSNERFAWYHEGLGQRREAGKVGGLKSAQRPRDEKGHFLPGDAQTESKQTPSDIQATGPETPSDPSKSKPLILSSSYSSLVKIKDLRTKGEVQASLDLPKVKNPPNPKIQNEVGYFIGSYVKAFQARYPDARPDLRGKVQGHIKTLLKDYPLDKAIELIQAYCQMEGKNSWFVTKGHDFGTFMENLNPIQIALAQGQETGVKKQKSIQELWAEMEAEEAKVSGARR